jgi:hypothetical protein
MEITNRVHVIIAIYFSEDVPTTAQLDDLVLLTSRFAGITPDVEWFDIHGKTVLEERNKMKCVGIYPSESICSLSATAIGAKKKNAVLDADYCFTYDFKSQCGNMTFPSHIIVSYNLESLIAKQMLKSLNIHLIEVFGRVESLSPICGLVDVSQSSDSFNGTVYGTLWPRTAPFHRWLERVRWLNSIQRGDVRLRRLYWGNYIGVSMLKYDHTIDSIFSSISRLLSPTHGIECPVLHRYQKGIYFSLTNEIYDLMSWELIGIDPRLEVSIESLATSSVIAGYL